jgi:hypothetical protein
MEDDDGHADLVMQFQIRHGGQAFDSAALKMTFALGLSVFDRRIETRQAIWACCWPQTGRPGIEAGPSCLATLPPSDSFQMRMGIST